MTRAIVLLVLASGVFAPAAAQVSASYKLEEHTFNAGGPPGQGSIAGAAWARKSNRARDSSRRTRRA